MFGGFNAIISQLAEKIGEPFKSFPVEATWYGLGGVSKWGTICGALNGISFATNLLVPQKDVEAICNEVIEWHNTTLLPSTAPDNYTGVPSKVRVVPGSPLCHISRSKFEAGKPSQAEIAERCSKLTGDIAAKTVEVLNAYYSGKFVPTFNVSDEVINCKRCHPGPRSYGMMDCTPCHGDHTKK